MLPTGRVTFLFTDIEGSTRLFQQDHAAMDAALVEHHEILTDAIERNSGRVFQIIGDAFCAAFEHPDDAARASVDAQRALHARVMPGIGQIKVRMGIHTGDIAMRDGTYASSLTLVKVQRVMSAGHGGQTLVSDETAVLLGGRLNEGLTLRELGAYRLRGLASAVDLYQLIEPTLPAEFPPLKSVTVDPTNPSTLLELLQSGVLVGRDRELAELREHMAVALGSRGHLVLLSGEPGVGKTQLSSAIMDEARLAGAVTMSGGSYEYEATTPYLPFVEAIRQWIHLQSPDRIRDALGSTAAEIVRFAPELDEKLGAIDRNPPLPPNEERLRLFDNVARFIERASASNGMVFLIDDLHWADESTLALLHYLIRHLRSSRVLFIGAYREVELDRRHPLSTALVDWSRERLTSRIQLTRLTQLDTASLLATLLGQEVVSDELHQLLFTETEGNPFFVQESVKALIEQGSIYREDDEWKRREISELAVPQSVKEAVGRRLNRLSETTMNVLHIAAALGKQFGYDELAAVVDASEDDLLDALDEAAAAQLVSSTPHDGFAFTHDKIREVLYQEVNPIRRRRMHQRIGDAMVAMIDRGDPVDPQQAAYHFTQSGDLDGVLDFSQRAAEAAARINAYDEAQRYLSEAEEAAVSLGRTDARTEVIERSGDLLFDRGHVKDAADRFEQALALGAGDREGYIKTKLGGAYAMASDVRGVQIVEEGLAAVTAETDPVWHAIGLSSLGRFYHYQGRARDAVEVLERAYEIARPTDDESALRSIFSFLAGAHQHMSDPEGAMKWARELVALGERKGNPLPVALGNEYLAENMIIAGRARDSIEFSLRVREIGEEIGALGRVAWSWYTLSQGLHGLGRLAEARTAIKESLDLALRLGDERLATWCEPGAALLEADMGNFEDAMTIAEQGLERSRELNQPVLRIWALTAMAHVYLRSGALESAAEIFERCVSEARDGEVRVFTGFYVAGAVEAHLRLGNTSRAREIADQSLRMPDSGYSDAFHNSVRARIRNRFAIYTGTHSEALEALSTVIAEAQESGDQLGLARSLVLRSRVLDEIDRPDEAAADRERSETILTTVGGVAGL